MSDTTARVLQLLSLLQTHRYWPGAELARRLEVSVRTLRRDVDRLRELGYPVQAQRGSDGGYQLAAGAVLPPLVLDDDEAVALALGLQAAARSGVTGVAEASVRALTKVVQVLPPRLRRRVDSLQAVTVQGGWGGAGPVVDPGVLTAVAQACRDTERLGFAYTAADGARTDRHVEPYRLVPLGRRWYLVAYDLHRHEWRSFRLDRLATPAGTGERFLPRALPASDAAAFVRERLSSLPAPYAVEVVVHAPADAVRKKVGTWASVSGIEPDGDAPDDGTPDGTPHDAASQRCVVRMTTDTLDWAALVVGTVDAEVTVVSPPELGVLLGAWAGRFARAAAGPAPAAR